MADLQHSRVLFVTDHGQQMRFYIVPSDDKLLVKPIIEHGGGVVTSKLDSTCVKLAVRGKSVKSDDYVSIDFVLDSAKENRLLEMEKYRVGRDDVEISSDDSFGDMGPAVVKVKSSARELKGRKKFLRQDDMKIIRFILDNNWQSEVNGNVLWKNMEAAKVCAHTWQSMKDRYRRYIVPKIRSYSLQKHEVARLTGNVYDAAEKRKAQGQLRVWLKSTDPLQVEELSSEEEEAAPHAPRKLTVERTDGAAPPSGQKETRSKAPETEDRGSKEPASPDSNMAESDLDELDLFITEEAGHVGKRRKRPNRTARVEPQAPDETKTRDNENNDELSEEGSNASDAQTLVRGRRKRRLLPVSPELFSQDADAESRESAAAARPGAEALQVRAKVTREAEPAAATTIPGPRRRRRTSDSSSQEPSQSLLTVQADVHVAASAHRSPASSRPVAAHAEASPRHKATAAQTKTPTRRNAPGPTTRAMVSPRKVSPRLKSAASATPSRASPRKAPITRAVVVLENLTVHTKSPMRQNPSTIGSHSAASPRRAVTGVSPRRNAAASPPRNAAGHSAASPRRTAAVVASPRRNVPAAPVSPAPGSSRTPERQAKSKPTHAVKPLAARGTGQADGAEAENSAEAEETTAPPDVREKVPDNQRAKKNLGRQFSLRNLVMESQMDTQEGTMTQESEGDDVDDVRVDQLERLMQAHLAVFGGLTESEYLSILNAHSGSVRDAAHWILHGDSDGCAAWTEEDDATLLHGDRDALRRLRDKMGAARVEQRRAFLIEARAV